MALASGVRRLRLHRLRSHGRSPRRLPRSHLPIPHRRRSETLLPSIQTLATHRRSEPSPLIPRRQGGDPPLPAIHLRPIRFRHEARSPMRSKLLQLKRRRIRHGLGSLLESDARQAPRLPRDHGSRDGVVRSELQEPEEALLRLLRFRGERVERGSGALQGSRGAVCEEDKRDPRDGGGG